MKKTTYQFGNYSEKLARIFLILKGYKILTHNYKSKFGEIDVIALKSQTIVFIEVKARKKDELIETILRKKQLNRIKNAAEYFIAQNPEYQNFDIRFDFILFRESNIPEHHQNYF